MLANADLAFRSTSQVLNCFFTRVGGSCQYTKECHLKMNSYIDKLTAISLLQSMSQLLRK